MNKRFTRSEKASIVKRYDAMTPEERGAMLSELHVSFSSIPAWRKELASPPKNRSSAGQRIMEMLKREEFLNEGLIDEDISYACAKINSILSAIKNRDLGDVVADEEQDDSVKSGKVGVAC